MKPVQCKNCKHFVRDIFYKSEGICGIDGKDTREHHVCNLLDTDENRRETNGSGIAEGRNFKDKSFNLVQMPNRNKKD